MPGARPRDALPVSAGESYLVGEEGPEVVTFERSGYVIPNGSVGRAVGGGGLTVIVHGINNLAATLQTIWLTSHS